MANVRKTKAAGAAPQTLLSKVTILYKLLVVKTFAHSVLAFGSSFQSFVQLK